MDPETLIVWGIIAIIAIGSFVANLLKKQQEERAERDRLATGRNQPTKLTDLDRAAAARREQLRQTARQRTGEPENLTMAERVERARAKAQYQQRAADLAQRRRDIAEAQREVAAHRQQELDRQRLAQQQARERTRRQEMLQQQQQRAREAARQQERQRQGQRNKQQAQRREPKTEQPFRRELQWARPHEQAAPRKAIVSLADLRGRSLLKAIALKELLDQPVAMRDPKTHPINIAG